MIELFPRFPLADFFEGHEPDEIPTPNPAMLPLLTSAELIFCRELSTGGQFLVFGRELLRTIANIGLTRPVKGVVVEIDQSQLIGALERLLALVQTIKGHDDYRPGEFIQAGDDDDGEEAIA
jgi:hypothetical protein